MPRTNYKDPLTGKDTRYELIRVMYDKGHITFFSDIFKFIPKTIVGREALRSLQGFFIPPYSAEAGAISPSANICHEPLDGIGGRNHDPLGNSALRGHTYLQDGKNVLRR